MPFEKFVPAKKATKAQKAPVVKMLKGGQISFNAAAYEQYMKGATHIELYYDSTSKKIGLQPKKYKTKAAFKIRTVGKGKATYRVNAKPLVEHYDIRLEEKVALTPTWNDAENLMELTL
ncbi:MAG: hypothetical protein JSU61_00565 [Fidelibacterota bacterium]|nr:MAG: hypothetical protein JSU61_00565 [Candidatus Neomarinimicrobiota bacterium]